MFYRPPTTNDYDKAIKTLIKEKCEVEVKLERIKEIIKTYEFNDDFKITLIKTILKEDENEQYI